MSTKHVHYLPGILNHCHDLQLFYARADRFQQAGRLPFIDRRLLKQVPALLLLLEGDAWWWADVMAPLHGNRPLRIPPLRTHVRWTRPTTSAWSSSATGSLNSSLSPASSCATPRCDPGFAPHAPGVQDATRERPRANHTHRLLQLTEGELTEKKKRYTRNAVLALAARELGLPECLLVTGHPMSSPQGATKVSADLLEAVIAALFLDQGIDQANRFCEAVLFFDRHRGGTDGERDGDDHGRAESRPFIRSPLYAKPTDPALGTDICAPIHLSCCDAPLCPART